MADKPNSTRRPLRNIRCPYCERDDFRFMNKLRSHMFYAHPDKPRLSSAEGAAALAQANTKTASEEPPEVKTKMPEPCVNCQLKDLKIKQLEDDKAKAEASATDALKKAAEAEKKEVPGLFDYIRHAEGVDGVCSDPDCPVTKQWREAKAAIIQKAKDDMTPDEIESRAVALGLMEKRFKVTK